MHLNKRITLFICLNIFSLSLICQTKCEVEASDSLSFYYSQIKNDSTDNQSIRRFFDFFPKDYNCFMILYGETNSVLANKAYEHMLIVREIDQTVGNQQAVELLVGIAIEADLRPDAMTIFQHLLRFKFMTRKGFFIDEFVKLDSIQLYNFFYFYMNEIGYLDKEIPEEFNSILSDPKLGPIMQKAFNDLNS
jgi:hypothetical protein